MANQHTSLIEKYYDGLLTAEETAQFNELKNSDVDFQAELAIFEKAEMLLELDALHALKENARKLDKMTTSIAPKKASFQWMRIAASVLLLAAVGGLFYTQNTYSNESLYQDNYTVAGDHISDLGNGKSEVEAALEFYNKNEYAKAEAAFSKIATTDTDNQVARYYLGQSQLLNNKPEQGIVTLQQVTGDYQPEARWYAALAQLRTEDTESCKTTLESIIKANQDQTFVNKAKKLKAKLDSPLRRLVL